MKWFLVAAVFGLALAELDVSIQEETELLDNPEEGEFFEGDMILPYNPFSRNAKKNTNYKWPNAVVYYEVDPTNFAQRDLDQINKGIQEYHTKTCIRFIKRTTEPSFVRISRSSSGCFATVGKVSRNNSPQRINLGNGCTTRLGTVVHEMAHMLGFHHEQSRPDRDNYVTIDYSNIPTSKQGNFRKYTTNDVTTLGLPYDYGSVMHYGAYGFAIDRSKPTIITKKAGAQIGQRNGFSSIDVQKINAYYCAGGKTGAPVSTTKAPVTNPGTSFSCSFDSGVCGMIQSKTDNFDWAQRSGSTPSSGTGPTTGSYMYMEASAKNVGDKTSIITPAVKASGKYALRFRYHMFGPNMGSLVVKSIVQSKETTILTANGDKGNQWNNFCVPVTATSGTISMSFTGTVGSGFRSDIAVDDVSIMKGDCSTNPVTQPPVSTKPPTTTGQTLFGCTFESSTCGMAAVGSAFKWVRRAGPTPSQNTGPATDATGSSTKYYIYAEASGPQPGEKATLTTPAVTIANGVGCLSFNYHMYGAAMGTLNVYIKTSQAQRFYTKTNDQGNRWVLARITLRNVPAGVKFVFEAERGSSYASDIALDNISLREGAC